MKQIAIITARGGSKRIPRKNIKDFCGQPILNYSIEAALESGIFDEVMVSTDDEEIAEVAKKAGAAVPFMRSESTSNDYATTNDVLMEVLMKYQELGQRFKNFCCIYPTAPFVTAVKLIEAMKMLEEKQVGSIMPVVRFSFPPQRGVYVRDNKLELVQPEYYKVRSQDIEPVYHDCGLFYCANTEAFLQQKSLMMGDTMPIILPEEMVQDIDTLDDWKMAEMKYKLLNGKLQ